MKPATCPRSRAAGFSLIEIAISTIIISVMMTAGLKLLAIKSDASAIRETREKQLAIKQAMAIYLSNNNVLPCPDLNGDGRGDRLSSGAGECGLDGIGTGAQYFGYLPYGDIEFDSSYAADEYGNYFTYVVSKEITATSKPTPIKPPYIYKPTGSIKVFEGTNGSGLCSHAVTPVYQAAFAIVSHGKNGYWARTRSGTNDASTKDMECDRLNSVPTDAVYKPLVINTSELDSFDDIVTAPSVGEMIVSAFGVTATAASIVYSSSQEEMIAFLSVSEILKKCTPLTGNETIFAPLLPQYAISVNYGMVNVSSRASPPVYLFSVAIPPATTTPLQTCQ